MILAPLLNVLVSDINTALAKMPTNDRLTLTFEKSKVGIQRITRTHKDRHHVDSVYVLPDATFGEAHHYLVGFQCALSFITEPQKTV